jgi:hypothetical protein
MTDEAAVYPRIYRYGISLRAYLLLAGSVALIGGPAAMAWVVLWSDPPPPNRFAAAIYGSSLGIACMLMGAGFILAAIKQHIILYADAIETVGIFFRRKLRREDIGAKAISPGIIPSTVLIPWRKDQRRMQIENSFNIDEVYRQWIDGIPDADRDFFRDRRRGLLTGPKTT